LEEDNADESNNYTSQFLSYDDKEDEDELDMVKAKSGGRNGRSRRYSAGR
jgi:hypothetical protein